MQPDSGNQGARVRLRWSGPCIPGPTPPVCRLPGSGWICRSLWVAWVATRESSCRTVWHLVVSCVQLTSRSLWVAWLRACVCVDCARTCARGAPTHSRTPGPTLAHTPTHTRTHAHTQAAYYEQEKALVLCRSRPLLVEMED